MSRAVVYNAFGSPEVLEQAEVPDVTPTGNEVAVRVRAAGLNPFDFKVRSGLIPMVPPIFPKGIGSDVAGIVEEVGPDARYADGTEVTVGDEVMGWSDEGAIRERTITLATNLCRKPAGLDWAVAGSLTVAGLTARACIDLMQLSTDDVVLVSAAAGSVGLLFCQLARRAGANVIGTASPSNHEFLRSLGVTPVEYGPGLVDRVQAIAHPTWMQDCQGRESIDAGLKLGIPADHICSIVDHAAVAELGLASPGRYERSSATLAHLAELLATGKLVLPVAQTFPLDEVREAFRQLETRHISGKLVILP